MVELGDYRVHRLIGEGGMGKVYEGEEKLSKRKVALKVLHPELARSEDGRRLFLNEMQILAQLEHPNIVRSLASTEVGGELVMVLELLDGRTLRAVLNDGRLPWVEAVRIASSVAAALTAAHDKEPPVIHRDLKPENIMVLNDGVAPKPPPGLATPRSASGLVKVMDFGIAKVVQALNQTNTQSVGTLQYMSPEQIDAHAIDHRSDLYCLGLVLYEMLAGAPPFSSASPRQLLNLQCTAEPPPLPDDIADQLPKGVHDLVFQLLEKAPEDRPYLASDVVERLEPFLPARPRLSQSRGSGAGTPGNERRTPRAAASASTPQSPLNERKKASESSPDAQSSSAEAFESQSPDDLNSKGASARSSGAQKSDRGASKSSPGDETSGSGAPRSSSSDRKSGAGASRSSSAAAEPRNDTIALLEEVERRRREVPRVWAIGIIVALSLLAGFGAYGLRATSAPSTAPVATAAAPSRAP